MPRRANAKAAALSSSDGARAATLATYEGAEGSLDEANRRVSLASRLEDLAQQGALAQAVKENRPEVDACRRILQKPIGKRSLDDVYTLKSLLSASRLLDFFSNLDAYKIDRLYQALSLVTFGEKGAFIFREGDPGEKFYMVFTGQVEIVRHDDAAAETGQPDAVLRLALLRPGDTFGERAIVSDADMRAASAVVASATAELVFISRVLFKDLLRESQEAEAGANTLEKRFRSNKDIIRNIFVRHSAQRSEKDLKFAVEYLKSVKFFSRFSFEVRKQLCKAMRLISAVTNTVLFEEGQVGKHFYIIFSGSVEVSVRSNDRFGEVTESVVSRLSEGDYFGELALSETDGIRRATVVCTDYCELLVLSRDQYEPLIKKYQNEYHAQYAHLLRQNAYFIGPEWDDNTIEGMCSVMTEKYIPFRGEICKQGSRASELFVITRGECRMIHEGKHPITNQPQLYELGRYGPNAIIGCAEASAGKFNDIFVRDYSVVAESPVRLLVLSRFDIFHLMSPEARESLQRSAAGFSRESIESRALKTVAWEKYRKKFLNDVIAAKRPSGNGLGSPDRSLSRMAKSSSTPVLPTERSAKQLIEPGCLVLKFHGVRLSASDRQDAKASGSQANTSSKATALHHESSSEQEPPASSEPEAPNELQRRHSDSLLPASPENSDTADALPERSAPKSRRHSLAVNAGHLRPDGLDAPGTTSPLLASSTISEADPTTSPTDRSSAIKSDATSPDALKLRSGGSVMPLERRKLIVSAQARASALARSRTLTALHPLDGITSGSGLPPLQYDKPLHDPSITSNQASRRRSVKVAKPERAAAVGDALSPVQAKSLSVSAIWSPVHGVCQPFSLLGFMKEVTPVTTRAPSTSATKVRAHPLASAHAAGPNVSDAPRTLDAKAPEESAVVAAFRVFGKFRDLNETLHMFRLVCGVERTPRRDSDAARKSDTSRFAIYKDDEMTMALENFFSPPELSAVPSPSGPSEPLPRSHEFRATDVLHGTGQRFACVNVILRVPATAIENVSVHVYQCFPTLQSATRFAKQMLASTLTVSALYIVPLFAWIPLADLERFDAKASDLEQALECVTDSGSSAYRSTWKARKDAVRKARALQPRSSSSSSSSKPNTLLS